MKNICIYCGSSPGSRDDFRRAARQMGKALVKNKLALVYGGAGVGLMGALADTVMQSGGEVHGVIPRFLMRAEIAHAQLTKLHIVDSMHERKTLMAELSDGFIALPGGFGTLEELTEIITWSQLGIHRKPIGILNTNGYYDGLLTFLRHAVAEQFIRQHHFAALHVDADPERLLGAFTASQ